jgi:hypothetical protein
MKLSNYLTKDGKLTQTLEFSEHEGGINPSTYFLTIEPSGEWREQRIQLVGPNAPPRDEPQQGQLTPNQLAALAHQLAALELLNLPDKLGKPFPVSLDFSYRTIRFGDKKTTLNLFADLPLPAQDPEAAAVARFIALKLVIEFWTKDEEQRAP